MLKRTDVPASAICAGFLLLFATASPASADRHCSFARENAFYARELSAEATKTANAVCPAKNSEALNRLRDTLTELEICSCSVAEQPLRRWLENQPPTGAETGDTT